MTKSDSKLAAMSIPERNDYLDDFWTVMEDQAPRNDMERVFGRPVARPSIPEAEAAQAEQDFLELGLSYLDRTFQYFEGDPR